MEHQQTSPGGKPAYDVIRFQTNIPEKVALAFNGEGLTVKSSKPGYGDQILYTLVGNRRMYVAPIVAEKIAALGIQKGDEFLIGKREYRDGQKRSVRWFVEPVTTEPESPLARDLKDSIPIANAIRAGEDPRAATEAARAARQPESATRPAAARPMPNTTMPSSAPIGVGARNLNDGAGTSNGTAPKIPPTKIPYDVAFQEIVRLVADGLKAAGEQWSDTSRQDAVSTILIAASREGWLAPWNRTERP